MTKRFLAGRAFLSASHHCWRDRTVSSPQHRWGPAYSLYGVQVPRGTNLYASSGKIDGATSAASAGTLEPCTYTT